MAILLVDNNDSTAFPLQAMLTDCLPFPVLRIQDEDHAFRLLEHSAPKLILCHHNAPDINVGKIGRLISQRPDWNHIPFIAITDHYLPIITTQRWKKSTTRIDKVIGAPIFASSLFTALAAAAQKRSEASRNLSFFGNRHSRFEELKKTMQDDWALNYQTAEKPSRELEPTLTVAVLDLASLSVSEVHDIGFAFKTSKHRPLVFCLGGKAEAGLKMRYFCQSFAPVPKSPQEWEGLASEIATAHRHRWELSALEFHWQRSNRDHDFVRMKAVANKMKSLATQNARTQMALGESLIASGESGQSKKHFLEAVRKNPYHVKGYRRLFQHFSHDADAEEIEKWTQAFIDFCPNVPALVTPEESNAMGQKK